MLGLAPASPLLLRVSTAGRDLRRRALGPTPRSAGWSSSGAPMICESCHQNLATVHLTEIVAEAEEGAPSLRGVRPGQGRRREGELHRPGLPRGPRRRGQEEGAGGEGRSCGRGLREERQVEGQAGGSREAQAGRDGAVSRVRAHVPRVQGLGPAGLLTPTTSTSRKSCSRSSRRSTAPPSTPGASRRASASGSRRRRSSPLSGAT